MIFPILLWDARGHGYSPGERGDSPSLALLVADVDDFIRHIQSEYGIKPENICVDCAKCRCGIVSTWLHDYAPKTVAPYWFLPAFKVKLYVPFARIGLKNYAKMAWQFLCQQLVKAHYLTHNVERQKKATTMIR